MRRYFVCWYFVELLDDDYKETLLCAIEVEDYYHGFALVQDSFLLNNKQELCFYEIVSIWEEVKNNADL